MKILIKGNFLDFKSPVYMEEKQKDRFLSFMKDMFPKEIEILERQEKTKKFGDREAISKRWTVDELVLLLGPKANSEIARILGRNDMSVRMKRGDFVFSFLEWLKIKGYSSRVSRDKLKEFIRKYLEEREG